MIPAVKNTSISIKKKQLLLMETNTILERLNIHLYTKEGIPILLKFTWNSKLERMSCLKSVE